jgi:hypothetical protein
MNNKVYIVEDYEVKAPCKKDYALEKDYRVDCKKFLKELEKVNIANLNKV